MPLEEGRVRALPLERLELGLFPEESEEEKVTVTRAIRSHRPRSGCRTCGYASIYCSAYCLACGHAPVQLVIRCGPSTCHQIDESGDFTANPISRADAGRDVLELLYCQSCGEVFLGGYRPEDSQGGRDFLVPFLADLERVPDRVVAERTAANYVIYWPQPPALRQPVRQDRNWGGLAFALGEPH